MKNNFLKYENKYYEKGYKLIAGVDEVGRGCLAGPLVVACCILPRNYSNPKIKDSKKLTQNQREQIYHEIIENAVDYSIFMISPKDVDKLNPKRASIKAMECAVKKMKIKPDVILVDFEKICVDCISESIIKGDEKSLTIAASSIIAKVVRDNYMTAIAKSFPSYKFDKHKGYGTKKHLEAIKKYGVIKGFHRLSYKPVKEVIKNGK